MKIVSLNNVVKEKAKMEGAVGAWKQLIFGSEHNVPVYSYRVFTIDPEGNTSFHIHPYEHMNYVIEGEGILVNEKGDETLIKTGDFTLIQPMEKHQYKNRGNKPFIMLCGLPKEFE